MTEPYPKIPQSELSGRLQKLMFLRVLFVSFFLGASIFIQIKETKTYFGNIQTSHYFLIAAIYLVTIIYILIHKYFKNVSLQAYLQLLFDTLFITAIIFTTGGIESIFSFLYILCIIYGSIILYRKGGMIVASSSSILYGLLLDLHYYGAVHPLGARLSYPEQYERFHLFYIILVNIAAFYLVAYLTSYLSEQTRKSHVELEAKQMDIDKLEVLNESIINSITSGLIALDGYNRIILFNPAAEEIFGIKASQAYGQKVEQAFPFLGNYLSQEQFQSTQTAKKLPPFIDLPYLRPDKDETHLRLSISPLRLPLSDEKGHILIFQNMTEIKLIEEKMKRVEGLALVGELAAGIAHEIRNPMASISGSIQLLRDGLEKDDVNRRLMDITSREIDRLNHLVSDFLLFARPKRADLEKFDLHKLILESLELFKNSRHWTEQIGIVTNFGHHLEIESDPEIIKQVLWNLFLNACEAMSEGGSLYVVIEDLETNSNDPDQKIVKIIIRDTGPGFDENVLPQLFTPFFTTKEGGSGLGLAIVKGIVEGLQGEVFGSNHPEGGAEITILLPVSPFNFPPTEKN